MIPHNLWFDEAISYLIARLPLDKLLLATGADTHPPLYYLLLHPLATLADPPLWLLRAPSFIFFLLSILVFWAWTKNKVALSLFAFSPLLLYFAFETRMYSLLVLLSLCSTICLLSKRNALFVTFYTFTLFTHYFALALLPFYLSKSKLTLLPLLFFIPWLLFILPLPHPTPLLVPIHLSIPASLASFSIGGTGIITLRQLVSNPILDLIAIYFLYYFFKNFHLRHLLLFSPLLYSLSPRSCIILTPYFYLVVARHLPRYSFLLLLLANLILLTYHPPVYPPTSAMGYYSDFYYHPTLVHYLADPIPLSSLTHKLITTSQ